MNRPLEATGDGAASADVRGGAWEGVRGRRPRTARAAVIVKVEDGAGVSPHFPLTEIAADWQRVIVVRNA
jgi:hypothetical protein